MQRALVWQTSVKLEHYVARVVILLLALTSLLSCAASEPVLASDAYQLNESILPAKREAGSSAAIEGATGPPGPDASQHPPHSNRVESSPDIKVRGADHTGPFVCQTTDIFRVLTAPAADCCPAEGIVDNSAEDRTISPVQGGTNDTATPERLVPVDETSTPSQPHPSDPSPAEEERHNFALSKDGAKIIASNKEAKKPSAILDTDSDTFMKNECKADKWCIIELSQVAKVVAFQLSQYELYSSRVKDFEVRGRQAHPRAQGGDYAKTFNTTGWSLLGKYAAAKMKGSQTFKVSEPVWLKYLQFHFITHHGSEPICALNDILVFGKSAAEDLEDQLSDEALAFTEDSHPQQPSIAVHASASADRQHGQVDTLGNLEKLAVGAAEADLSSEGAVNSKHSSAAVEAHAGETANKSSAWAMSMSGKAASEAIRESHAAEQAAEGPHSGGDVSADRQHPALSSPKEDSVAQHASVPQPADTAAAAAAAAAAETMVRGPQAATLESNTDLKADPKPDSKSDTSAEELLLLHNSASSSKARHGGSIYDMLVQEIKSLKLQQKQAPRQLAELQRNLSQFMDKTTAEFGILDQAVKGLQADLDSLQQLKVNPEASNTAVARFADVDVDLHSVLAQLESMHKVLHQVNQKSINIAFLAVVGWLLVIAIGVVILTAPALGQLTWSLWLPISVVGGIGVVWVLPVGFRILAVNSI